MLEADEDELDSKKDDIKDALVSYAAKGKLVPSKINEIADKFEVAGGIVEQYTLELLCAVLKGVGKHKDVPDDQFDSEQLKLGMKVEQEHTGDPYIAKIIAKDHLKEIPDYYSRLKKMEKQAGVKD